MNKVKILACSDLVTPTGFARVSHSIFGNIKDFIDFRGIGVNYSGDPHDFGLKIFPARTTPQDIYGFNRLPEFVSWKPDVIFILNDVWVINQYLNAIRKIFKEDMPEIVVYFPVDAEEHDPSWYVNFDLVTVAVTYTEFAKQVVLKAAPELESKLQVIPHGVDDEVFYKVNQTRNEVRKNIFHSDKAEDLFLFLSAARNQPRKRLDITMEGYSLALEQMPDSKLYMHCGIEDASMNINKLAKRYGLENNLIITSMSRGIQRVPEEMLNLIYNACDVGLNTSLGEGWSLPNIEHAMTGAVQIVPNHSALSELYYDCGILVPARYKYTMDNIMTVGKLITPEDLAEAMVKLYKDRDLYNTLSQKGLEKFSKPEYRWENISKQWLKIFLEV